MCKNTRAVALRVPGPWPCAWGWDSGASPGSRPETRLSLAVKAPSQTHTVFPSFCPFESCWVPWRRPVEHTLPRSAWVEGLVCGPSDVDALEGTGVYYPAQALLLAWIQELFPQVKVFSCSSKSFRSLHIVHRAALGLTQDFVLRLRPGT